MTGELPERLDHLLRESDQALAPRIGQGSAPLARAAITRARRRRSRRRVASAAIVLLIVAVAIVQPRWRARQEIARLRAEVADLRARSDKLATEITQLRRTNSAAADQPAPRLQLAQSVFTEARDRAAFTLLRSADRCEQLAGASDVAAETYRSLDRSFAATPWAAAARQKLSHKP